MEKTIARTADLFSSARAAPREISELAFDCWTRLLFSFFFLTRNHLQVERSEVLRGLRHCPREKTFKTAALALFVFELRFV